MKNLQKVGELVGFSLFLILKTLTWVPDFNNQWLYEYVLSG